MALSGDAAMILFYDIAPEAIADHDDWHTHEHMPERLSIPGFLRASRWVAEGGTPRYLILYEVGSVDVLSSAPYLDRLNNPTPWTARMMSSFRGMVRGFCSLKASSGLGLGHALLALRYSAAAGRESELREWLAQRALTGVCAKPGLASAHMFEPAARPPMTMEQSIRGTDEEAPCVLLLTGYSPDAVARIAGEELDLERLERHGGKPGSVMGRYRLDFLLSARRRDPGA